jgi:hypothetical protein
MMMMMMMIYNPRARIARGLLSEYAGALSGDPLGALISTFA